MSERSSIVIRHFGCCEYRLVTGEMRAWTHQRSCSTCDEMWVLEHLPVYSRGISCRDIPRNAHIPVVDSDRGGQITYHGPGQIVCYFLLDLRRLGLGIRNLIHLIEHAVVRMLNDYQVIAETKEGAPGVYVKESKVAAIGFRIHRGRCYHGLSLNVDMDLSPFQSIDPCGYKGLQVTQLKDLGIKEGLPQICSRLTELLIFDLGYEKIVTGKSEFPI